MYTADNMFGRVLCLQYMHRTCGIASEVMSGGEMAAWSMPLNLWQQVCCGVGVSEGHVQDRRSVYITL